MKNPWQIKKYFFQNNTFLLWLFERLKKLNEQRHLYSIRTTFISIMPIIIVGAYAVVINQLPIPAYQQFMAGLFGENWRTFGGLAFNATTQIVTLVVVFLICSNLTAWYNSTHNMQIHSGITGMVGLAAYFVVSLPAEGANALPFSITGVTGLFVALVVAVIAGEAMIRLSGRKTTMQLLSDDPNMAVPQSFASIIPAIIVISGFVLLRVLLIAIGISEDIPAIVNDFLRRPFEQSGDSVGTAVLYNISSHFMWLFGIHGNNVLDGVAQTVFVPAMEANITAAAAGLDAPNLVTKTLFDSFVYMGGSGTTLALLISLLIFVRGGGYRTLIRYALPNSIFNINEPLVFGVPIVLNPFYAIPFVFTPVLMFFTTYLAMKTGLVPYTINEVSWATPILISGYIATGSVAGAILQLVNLGLAVMVYTPFVRLSEKMAQMSFDSAYQQLMEVATGGYDHLPRKLINRVDEVGAVARRLSNQLDNAMASNEMFLHYQPIVNVQEHKIHSVEALLRWHHPRHGPINPMITIALAEETDRISSLGLWIMEKAVSQRAQWTKEGIGDFHVSVNISPKQLTDPSFHKKVIAILNKHQVPPRQLQIEITETAALVENAATSDNLKRLHQSEVSIAMDDFGVGHSSLLYLRTQPITTLKIDGSLSRNLLKNPSNLDIIATIYDLCRLMDVETVVEFVDNEAQLNKLMGVGSFLIQGYLYSPPLNGNEIPVFIKNFNPNCLDPD